MDLELVVEVVVWTVDMDTGMCVCTVCTGHNVMNECMYMYVCMYVCILMTPVCCA